MGKRDEHVFRFSAADIAKAATDEAVYHRARESYWRAELADATARVRQTASVKIEEQPVTGGMRPVVTVDFGDQAAHSRLHEAFGKVQSHREAAERFETDAKVYGTQREREYELSTDDVHHYRLGGGDREE